MGQETVSGTDSEQRSEPAPERRRKKRTSRKSKRGTDETIRYTVSDYDPAAVDGKPSKPSRSRGSESPGAVDVEADEEAAISLAPHRIPVDLDAARIDQDASRVVKRLTKAGYEAYLVGGCVRDLLLGKSPKDFDVATSARPDAVRDLFRNSRIIGRRFRLVHVLFADGKVIETATFRRNPTESDKSDDLLIRDDNTFGRADEDAARRDFTINALFYDLDSSTVLDWCGGMSDIAAKSVRTIGDPVIRFKEDPVRMLRAIKFSARLDLGIEPETYHALVQCRGTLAMAARPRLFEEVLRLLRGGAAHRSVWLMWETGILDVLLPELSSYLYDVRESDDRVWRLLDQVDLLTKRPGKDVDDIVLITLLLLEPMMEACDGQRDRITSGHDFLEPLIERLALPRRIADAIRRIVAILPRLAAGRAPKFQRSTLYPCAKQVLDASLATGVAKIPAPPPSSRRRKKKRQAGSVNGSSGPESGD
jgi:poly(A) polymerase